MGFPPIIGLPSVSSGGGGGASDYLSTLTNAEISITGATTATINRQHVVTGTTSPYTVTLPAASGNAGNFLSFRFGPTLTQLSVLVTLDGNGSETIDGELTRICWAGESCTLYCDGSNWFKIAGKTIPMMGGINAVTYSTLVTPPFSVLTFNNIIINNTGQMCNIFTGEITILRPGNYMSHVFWQLDGSVNPEVMVMYAVTGLNGTINFNESSSSPVQLNDSPSVSCGPLTQELVAGDVITGYGFVTGVFSHATLNSSLHVVEVPQW